MERNFKRERASGQSWTNPSHNTKSGGITVQHTLCILSRGWVLNKIVSCKKRRISSADKFLINHTKSPLLGREARLPVLEVLPGDLLSKASCPNADTGMERAVTLQLILLQSDDQIQCQQAEALLIV